MFRSKTVFIVGAGASAEIGLPDGKQLKNEVSNLLSIKFDDFGTRQVSGDLQIMQAYRKRTEDRFVNMGEVNILVESGWQIKKSLPLAISIDNYMDAHKENEYIQVCGKLGITKSIIEAEKNSFLVRKEDKWSELKVNLKNIQNSWYIGFLKLLTENVAKSDIMDIFSNITFITFNYDRCIEHFLVNGLKEYYNLDERTAIEAVRALKVHHPFGTIGKLPWQESNLQILSYGSDKCDLLKFSNQIKTFNEQIEDKEGLREIHQAINDAEKLVFLGFAFHRQNLKLLTSGEVSNVKKIYATAYGVSKSDCEVIKEEIAELIGKTVHIELRSDLKCSELINEYWRSLTA